AFRRPDLVVAAVELHFNGACGTEWLLRLQDQRLVRSCGTSREKHGSDHDCAARGESNSRGPLGNLHFTSRIALVYRAAGGWSGTKRRPSLTVPHIPTTMVSPETRK